MLEAWISPLVQTQFYGHRTLCGDKQNSLRTKETVVRQLDGVRLRASGDLARGRGVSVAIPQPQLSALNPYSAP